MFSYHVWVKGREEPFVVSHDNVAKPRFYEDGSVTFRTLGDHFLWAFTNYEAIQLVRE